MPAFFQYPTNQSSSSHHSSGRKFYRKFSPDGPINIHLFLKSFELFYQDKVEDKLRVQIFNCLDDMTLASTLPIIHKNASYSKIRQILVKTFGLPEQLEESRPTL